ncbi:MAG: cyclophilin-like family protein [Candidatus Thorarchaeota archaeon]
MSFNQFSVEFSIIGYETVGRATFIRQLSPQTVALIRYRLRKPIQSRVVVRDGEISIPFKIGRAVPETPKKEVQRGEVAYWPQSQTLIIFTKDKKINYPVNIVGEIDYGNLKFFDKLSIGKSIKLEMIKPTIDEEDYI